MAKLNAAARKKVAPGKFAGPDKSYPVEDKDHAEAALMLGKAAYNKGHISKAEYDHIRAMADKELGDKPKGAGH